MPQDTHHPLYDAMLPQWTRCRHAIQGTDAIKAQGEAYLPKPSGMGSADYEAYKTRATWFGASARTLTGLAGMVFRMPLTATVPVRMETQMADVTRTGMSLNAFAEAYFKELLLQGFGGILLDLQDDDIPGPAAHPQWTLYPAEAIINWRTVRLPNGETVLSHVVLAESNDTIDPTDPYKHVLLPQWRELLLDNGVYRQRLWRKSHDFGDFDLISTETPNRMKVELPFIPFYSEILTRVRHAPPLLDVVDVNLSHYRTSADYEHDLHMTCMKTPYVIGWEPENGELRMGGLAAWTIPMPRSQVEVGMIEPNGDSLQAKLDKLQAAEGQMAVLGARMLEPQKPAVEATTTHAIRQAGEHSTLQDTTRRASAHLTTVARWHAWWATFTDSIDDPEIQVQLNTDFAPQYLAPAELDAIANAYLQGIMTQESVWWNLQQGEMLHPEEDFETYITRLATQGPVLAARQSPEEEL